MGHEGGSRVQRVRWRKSRHSSQAECVELAWLSGDAVGVRNSRDPAGAVLHFTRGEMEAFVRGVKDGEFDDLLDDGEGR